MGLCRLAGVIPTLHKKVIVVDLRNNSKGDLVEEVKSLGIQILFNHIITNTKGRKKINSVFVHKINEKTNEITGSYGKIPCDLLCVSGGWTPTVHLFTQSRGKLIYRDSDATFVPHKSFHDEVSIGACNGTFALNNIIDETYSKISQLLSEFGKNIEKRTYINSSKIDSVCLDAKSLLLNKYEYAQSLFEGLVLGNYQFLNYKTEDLNKNTFTSVCIFGEYNKRVLKLD